MKKKLRVVELEQGAIGVLLAIPEGNEPPTEFRVLANGLTETTKGPILFDDKAGKAILGKFREHGLDALPFDVGHGMLSPFAGPDAHKAAGWFTPEVRKDGLYAADIEWTEYGASALRKREFRYFSPAIVVDGESGRALHLINIALTNIPATKKQKPLVASQPGLFPGESKPSMDFEEFLKLLGARTAAEALTRHGELTKLSDGLLQLSGKPTVAEALAEITRFKTQADEAIKLAQRVTELESERDNARRDAKIEALSKAGKLPPALHPLAKTMTLAQLDEFEKSAPVVQPSSSGGPAPTPPSGPSVTKLSDTEREIATQLGISEKDFQEHKASLGAAWTGE